MNSNVKAVYTGSFDPVTLGHLDIIRRACQLFGSVVVGVGINKDKKPLFSPSERIELIRRVTSDMPQLEIRSFDGLAVDFVREVGARVMVRGIRPLTDIAGEFTMMMANRQLDRDIETVFLMADDQYVHISSSLLKQIASMSDDDDRLAKFVPREIIADVRRQMA
ncbi:MAG: pantetheine-phosphate adenylyltransferase [Planctomycetaceae bacterium]